MATNTQGGAAPQGRQPRDDRPLWIQFLARVWVGIITGLFLGLGMTNLVTPSVHLRNLFAFLLILLLTIFGLSYFPFVGSMMKSMQRALVPKGAKGRLEQWFWHNALAAFGVVFILWVLAGAPASR